MEKIKLQTVTTLEINSFQKEKAYFNADKRIRFGIATDSHFARKPHANNQYFSHSLAKMKDFIEHMNRERVDFVIHLGDLKDEESTKTEAMTLSFLEEIEDEFSNFKGNTYHCVGNHDLDSINKDQFLEGICNTGIEKYKSYYSFDLNGVHFVVLDTNYDQSGNDMNYRKGGDWQYSFVSKEQLDWLKSDLDQTGFPVLVFCHHPLFEYCISGKKYHIHNHEEVRRILERSQKVDLVFQGHVHERHHQQIGNIHYVTMASMLESPGIENNRYGLVEIERDRILIHQIGPSL